MVYKLNEESSILSNDGKDILKAANSTGKFILTEIFKMLTDPNSNIDVVELVHLPERKSWLDLKRNYLLFDLTTEGEGVLLVEKYLAYINPKGDLTTKTEVVNISGGVLTTDGGIPILGTEGAFIDIPKESDVKIAKLAKAEKKME